VHLAGGHHGEHRVVGVGPDIGAHQRRQAVAGGRCGWVAGWELPAPRRSRPPRPPSRARLPLRARSSPSPVDQHHSEVRNAPDRIDPLHSPQERAPCSTGILQQGAGRIRGVADNNHSGRRSQSFRETGHLSHRRAVSKPGSSPDGYQSCPARGFARSGTPPQDAIACASSTCTSFWAICHTTARQR
jgi:hypothetical protein